MFQVLDTEYWKPNITLFMLVKISLKFLFKNYLYNNLVRILTVFTQVLIKFKYNWSIQSFWNLGYGQQNMFKSFGKTCFVC